MTALALTNRVGMGSITRSECRLFKKLRSHPHLKKTKSIDRHNLILKLERPGTVGVYKLLSGSHPPSPEVGSGLVH